MLSNDIKSYLDTYYEEMLKLLERLVNIDSGSACKEERCIRDRIQDLSVK